ncbi:MAG: M23 family metallopeptidase [Alphaproteobacteria bacterium]|nr:M23 family metallopeptidase [Alphaproteobacteria bacterium]
MTPGCCTAYSNNYGLVTGFVTGSTSSGVAFLTFPLDCADYDASAGKCGGSLPYTYGPYTPGMINAVLDHSLVQNPNLNNKPYQYGLCPGLDNQIQGFNGQKVSMTSCSKFNPQPIITKSNPLVLMGPHGNLINPQSCPTGYDKYYCTWYDDHPGYDYRAKDGTPVKASAAGTVVNYGGYRCYNSNLADGTPNNKDCEAWGFLGIDHGNSYITQYGHLCQYAVQAGQQVKQGDIIGYSGHRVPPKYAKYCDPDLMDACEPDPNCATHVLGPHLHFEVLSKIVDSYGNFQVVDPYGGPATGDLLYSTKTVPSQWLWLTPQ